jgi:hypothetical protein
MHQREWQSIVWYAALLVMTGTFPAPANSQPSGRGTRLTNELKFTLVVPPRVAVGRPTPLTLRVTNVAAHPVTVLWPGRSARGDVDFIVETLNDSQLVWNANYEKRRLLSFTRQTLQPRQTITVTEVWNQRSNDGNPVAPGQYRVRAINRETDQIPKFQIPPALLRIKK